MIRNAIFILVLFTSLTAASTYAQIADSSERVWVRVVPAATEVKPGAELPVAVVFDIDEGWHTWPNMGNTGGFAVFENAEYTTIEATTSNESALIPHAGFMTWPEVHPITSALGGGQEMGVFEGETIVYLPVTIPENAPLGRVTLTITVGYQSCDDYTCLKGVKGEDHAVEITIDPGASIVAPDASVFADFPDEVWTRIRAGETPPPSGVSDDVAFDLFGIISFDLNAGGTGLILLILVAALGGFLLNLTPCVLPVIPLKIMSLANTAGNRSRTLVLGFMMYLGIVGFWMALGGAIASIAAFTSTSQLFQFPAFTVALGLFIAVMAIGMCGVFSLRLPQAVYKISPRHDSLMGSFGFGIMTAILSTPCTAPFMGAAAAWAATQTSAIVLIVFAAIGNGMALPYLVLAAFPGLVERMPRTGPASEVIKQVMGLLMLAAAAYFLGVGVSGLTVVAGEPPSRVYIWIVAALVVAAGAWLAYKTLRLAKKTWVIGLFCLIGVTLMGGAAYLGFRLTEKGPIDWIYFTPQRFSEAQARGDIVVMEFTAEWCLNCKALEETVLRSERVADLLNRDGVSPIKVDLTGDPEDGNAMLTAVDRRSIPLLVIFAPDGREIFKGDFYTVQQVIDAIGEARDETVARKQN